MTKKCNPGVGAVPVIMIVLQIGPTYQTCIYFYAFEVAMQKKLMVLLQIGLHIKLASIFMHSK